MQLVIEEKLIFVKNSPSIFFLVLFLDSLDQLSDQDDGRALRWLPTSLPKNVHIVVSTLPITGGCLAVLKTKLKPENNADFYLEVCFYINGGRREVSYSAVASSKSSFMIYTYF